MPWPLKLCWICNIEEQKDGDQRKRSPLSGSDEVGLMPGIQEVGGLGLPYHCTILTRLAQQ